MNSARTAYNRNDDQSLCHRIHSPHRVSFTVEHDGEIRWSDCLFSAEKMRAQDKEGSHYMWKSRPAHLLAMGVLILCGFCQSALAQSAGQADGGRNADPHYDVLHNFQGDPDVNGNFDPLLVQGLVVDHSGAIFGESQRGGSVVCLFFSDGTCSGLFVSLGTEFKLDRHGDFTLLPNPATPGGPANGSLGPILFDDEGSLVFATVGGGANGQGGAFSLNPETGEFTPLFSFSGGPIDGGAPGTNIIRDPAGNLFGTTLGGGHNPPLACKTDILGLDNGCGTVYTLDADTHQETVLHSFIHEDGNQPVGLAMDSTGNLFGAASSGGDRSCRAGFHILGCGLIFQIDPSGHFTVLHEFHHSPTCPFINCPPVSDSEPPPEVMGWDPQFTTIDEGGNIFGVTGAGGNFGLGVIFKIDRFGQYTKLHDWAGPGDGFVTQQILLRDGKLYGINSEGGNILDCGFGIGCGTLWAMDTGTGEFEVLHAFLKIEEGGAPTALAFDQDGNLVGSNLLGGAAGVFDPNICTGGGGCGNVFRFKLTGRDNE